MKRVYVMGKMSSSNPIEFLENLRKGMRLSTEVLLAGYAVFSPFIDFQLFFQLRDGERIPVEVIKASSMKWLEVSHAGLLVPGWKGSKGTEDELRRADELSIPVFHTLEDLKREMPPKVKSWNFCGTYNMGCPYKLSDLAPVPCIASLMECEKHRGVM